MNENLEKQLKKLDEYDNAYYNDEPLISDAAYDLYRDMVYRNLPPDHPRLSKVGHPVCSAWPKEKHIIAMGSQNKVSTELAIRAWVEWAISEIKVTAPKFVLQHKIDGFSLEVQYVDGKIAKAITRGNGLIGENIYDNALLFRQIPKILPIKNSVVCRGEGVIFKNDFDLIQKDSGDHFKNARNSASGISRRLDGTYSKYIRLVTYDINARVSTETEKIDILRKLGFVVVPTHLCHTVDEILEIYCRIRDKERDTFPYDIDGLVLKLNDINLQKRLGYKKNRPEGQIALKFDSDKVITFIIDIVLQVGRTGKITPIAVLEPVELMGSTIKKASVHNFSYIAENGIGIGAEVVIEKRGDIIPQVTEVITEGETFEKPVSCPSCGGPIDDDGVNIWCRNKVCKERDINRIAYWIQTLDMKGFSEKFIEKLWDMNKIRSVSDLYNLTADDFIAIDGIGEKTIKTFFSTLNDTSEMYLSRFITAIGIPTCSNSTADVLVERFGTWEKISNLIPDQLESISGFAEVSAKNICDGIQEVSDLASDLLKVIKIKEKKEGLLTGKSFCVTGSLSSMGRKEFYELVVENGGIAKNSVSEGLTYLISNESSASSKMQKADKLGIKVINEEEFFNLIGGRVKKPVKSEPKKQSDEIIIVSESLF